MSLSERNAPSAAWGELVKAADAFRAESPWDILTEETIFGVLDPERGQIQYCTILGLLGEVYGLAVYPGPMAFCFSIQICLNAPLMRQMARDKTLALL